MNSFLHGPALAAPVDDPNTLPELLIRSVAKFGGKRITWIDRAGSDTSLTVQELFEAASAKTTLCESPLTPGLPFFIELWRRILAGQFVAIGDSLLENDELPIWEANQWRDLKGPSRVALALKTSGTTGAPKYIPQTHRALIEFCVATTQSNQLGHDDTSLNWMPLTHIGAIADFHLRPLYSGADQVHVATEWVLADYVRWFELIEQHRVAVTWAPNFAYGAAATALVRTARERPHYRLNLESLRFAINAGEAVLRSTVQRFAEAGARHGMKPDVIRPTWGMTETCSGMLYGINDGTHDGPFCNVGIPIPGAAVRVVDDHGHLLTPNTPGRLQVRGNTVSIARDCQETRDSALEDGWFDTGDLAVIANDVVTILGRAKEVIIVNGKNYSPIEIENVVADSIVPAEGPVCVFSMRSEGADSETFGVVFGFSEREDSTVDAAVRRARFAIANRFGTQPKVLVACLPEQIPRTKTGKIRREQVIRQWSGTVSRELNPKPQAVSVSWVPIEPIKNRGSSSSLTTLWLSADDLPTDDEFIRTPEKRLRLEGLLLENVQKHRAGSTQLLVVTHGAFGIRPEDDRTMAGALIAAIATTANREYRRLFAGVLDLDADTDTWKQSDALVMNWGEGDDCLIAYRNGTRFVLRDQPVTLHEGVGAKEKRAPAGAGPFVRGGIYVVTGATGGIGRKLIRMLEEEYGARVVGVAKGLGIDIADSDGALLAIKRRIRCVAKHGERISGIIHLASDYHEASLASETPSSFDAGLRAKVEGLNVIELLLSDCGDPLFLTFSSAAVHLGVHGLGSYIAANRILEAYVERRRMAGQMNSFCYSWTPWLGTGMAAKGDLSAAKARGHSILDPDWAVTVLQFLLHKGVSSTVIGTSSVADPEGVGHRVREAWADLLSRSASSIGPNDNFFELGGHSIVAVELIARLEKEFGVTLPPDVLPRAATIRQLTELLVER